MVAVKHAGAQIGEVHLGNALELLGNGVFGYCDAWSVHLRGHLSGCQPLHGFQPGLTQVLHDLARADARASTAAQTSRESGPAASARGDPGKQTVVVEVVDTGHRHPGQRQGPEQAGTKADGGNIFSFCGSSVTGGPTQPALGARVSGSQVCQMSMERKCERGDFG